MSLENIRTSYCSDRYVGECVLLGCAVALIDGFAARDELYEGECCWVALAIEGIWYSSQQVEVTVCEGHLDSPLA